MSDEKAMPLRLLARFGLVAYGAVNVLIASLVVQIAFGQAERADKKGALQEIGETGPGVVLLWMVTAGFVALVIWQLGEAVLGHAGVPGPQRALRIAVNVAEATIFGILAYSAGSVAAAGGKSTGKPSFAQVVFDLPGGRWLVGLAGLGLVVAGGWAVWRGVTHAFLRDLDLRGAGLNRSQLVTRIGQVGWTALGVVYGIPGVLLVIAAVRYDSERPAGLDSGLKALAGEPYGPVLLIVLAAGLLAFAVHCLFDARYRKA
jgi:Domain of Unknown Function (DUF1206)